MNRLHFKMLQGIAFGSSPYRFSWFRTAFKTKKKSHAKNLRCKYVTAGNYVMAGGPFVYQIFRYIFIYKLNFYFLNYLCVSMNWFMLTIHWWLPRTLVEQKHIWGALKQWEWIMVFASAGRNARYCFLGATLPSQLLTEVTLHANHPSCIWEVIWMPLALVAPKSAGDLVKPKVTSTN